MIASGLQRGAGRRAERRGVEVVVAETLARDPVHDRHRHRAAERARDAEAHVVDQHDHDVGRARRRRDVGPRRCLHLVHIQLGDHGRGRHLDREHGAVDLSPRRRRWRIRWRARRPPAIRWQSSMSTPFGARGPREPVSALARRSRGAGREPCHFAPARGGFLRAPNGQLPPAGRTCSRPRRGSDMSRDRRRRSERASRIALGSRRSAHRARSRPPGR